MRWISNQNASIFLAGLVLWETASIFYFIFVLGNSSTRTSLNISATIAVYVGLICLTAWTAWGVKIGKRKTLGAVVMFLMSMGCALRLFVMDHAPLTNSQRALSYTFDGAMLFWCVIGMVILFGLVFRNSPTAS